MSDPEVVVRMLDLGAQIAALPGLRAAIDRVLDHQGFVLGPEVTALEAALAERTGAGAVVSCANGTDALVLSLRALGVGPGDRVVVPCFTFAATAEAVVLVGAEPVFADIRADDFTIDVAALASHRAAATDGVVGVVPVDLFGHPADHDALAALADDRGWWVLTDAAQSFGASFDGRVAGSIGSLATTSFFPSKPLGCFGDGGAVFCQDDDQAALLRSLRNHGAGADRYENLRIGTNSRLDTIQAAILLEKLSVFDDELKRRSAIAERYQAAFDGTAVCAPLVRAGATSAWAQYTVRVPHRDTVAEALTAAGIGWAIYYRSTLDQQPAFAGAACLGELPVARAACHEVLSLPLHPYLDDTAQARVIDAVLGAVARESSG